MVSDAVSCYLARLCESTPYFVNPCMHTTLEINKFVQLVLLLNGLGDLLHLESKVTWLWQFAL